jgi:hypothetical protein
VFSADASTTLRLKESPPTMENCNLVVVDLLGREVYKITINPQVRQYLLPTHQWAEGMYTFKISIPNSSFELHGKIEVLH